MIDKDDAYHRACADEAARLPPPLVTPWVRRLENLATDAPNGAEPIEGRAGSLR